jgi:hypothetical protein
LADPEDQEHVRKLTKSGVLVEKDRSNVFSFSSPLAKRYFLSFLFPGRKPTTDHPTSLEELIQEAIPRFSASYIRKSTPSGSFPKEAIFQQLLTESLARLTAPTVSICSELSEIFPDSPSQATNNEGDKIKGEIDCYLNGRLRWGIELLVSGRDIREHLDRFSEGGKYYDLGVKDYAVIDFREGNASAGIGRLFPHPKRITVYFKPGDFSSCSCFFGGSKKQIELSLSQ